MNLFPQFELTSADACDDAAVDEQIGAGDETRMLSEQEGCCFGNLVAGACAACGRCIDHGLVTLTACSEFIVSQGSNDDTRRNGVDAGTTLVP